MINQSPSFPKHRAALLAGKARCFKWEERSIPMWQTVLLEQPAGVGR